MFDMVSCATVLPHSQKQLLETQLPREKSSRVSKVFIHLSAHF